MEEQKQREEEQKDSGFGFRPGFSRQASIKKTEKVTLNEDLYNEKEIMNDQLPIVPEQLDFLVARTTRL